MLNGTASEMWLTVSLQWGFLASFVPVFTTFAICLIWKVGVPAWRGNRDAQLIVAGFLASCALTLISTVGVARIPIVGLEPRLLGNLAVLGAMALALGNSYARSLGDLDRKNRDLQEVNLSMSRFLPDAFLALLSRGSIRDVVRGDNTELEITVLFSDIRGFTTISERIGTRAVFALINRYLEFVEPSIHDNHGFISQYYGDGVMALFHSSVDDAVRCTVEMHRAVERFNAASDEQLTIGVGLNTGKLMLGTIGGKDRLACNVIGDPVNLAARIEGMTKMYGARVLISDVTAAKVTSSGPRLRRLDRVVAKGKTQPMTLFEVIDADPPTLCAQKLHSKAAFEGALDDLEHARFTQAADAFDAIARSCPDDRAAAVLATRARALSVTGAPDGWDGAVRLVEK
jgi:two-component system sensor histidine kinase ChiS